MKSAVGWRQDHIHLNAVPSDIIGQICFITKNVDKGFRTIEK